MLHIDLARVQGWLPAIDQLVMDWFLTRQSTGPIGNLLEIGVYQGKTSIFMGAYLREGEELIACDLFDLPAEDADNRREQQDYLHYGDQLTAGIFASHYRTFHQRPPRIIRDDSANLPKHVGPDSCRLVHVDASHLYDMALRDILTAQNLLQGDGLIIVDDFRGRLSPGVGAAVWKAVFDTGLHPICVTDQKFYATWGDPEPLVTALDLWSAEHSRLDREVQHIAGDQVLRLVDLDRAIDTQRNNAIRRWPVQGSPEYFECR